MATNPKPQKPDDKVTCQGGFRQLAYQVGPDGRCAFCTVFQAGSNKACRFPVAGAKEAK